MQNLGIGFFDEPWLITMWGLFLFEFIEGNTITRSQFRKTLRHSKKSLGEGKPLTIKVREEARGLVNRIVHFLDIPIILVIVYCGIVRPDNWTSILIAIAIALVATALLVIFTPRLARTQS